MCSPKKFSDPCKTKLLLPRKEYPKFIFKLSSACKFIDIITLFSKESSPHVSTKMGPASDWKSNFFSGNTSKISAVRSVLDAGSMLNMSEVNRKD